jgi:hypothetical protein
VTYRITTANLYFSFNVFIRLPNNADMAWDRYVAPFSYGLWLAVAIAVSVLSVCLALTVYGHKRKQSLTVSAIFFYIQACFCQQGQSYNLFFISSACIRSVPGALLSLSFCMAFSTSSNVGVDSSVSKYAWQVSWLVTFLIGKFYIYYFIKMFCPSSQYIILLN